MARSLLQQIIASEMGLESFAEPDQGNDASHDDGPSDTPEERLQHPHESAPGEFALASSSSLASSLAPLPDYYKWYVCPGEDEFGNKIWAEYSKTVAEILEYIYNLPLIREEHGTGKHQQREEASDPALRNISSVAAVFVAC